MNPNISMPFGTSARAIAPPESLAPIPHAHINTAAIRMAIFDGTESRFMRPYSSDLLSQTVSGLIVQDEQGLMWFGTPNRLNRFDGYAFKTFVYDPGNPGSLRKME